MSVWHQFHLLACDGQVLVRNHAAKTESCVSPSSRCSTPLSRPCCGWQLQVLAEVGGTGSPGEYLVRRLFAGCPQFFGERCTILKVHHCTTGFTPNFCRRVGYDQQREPLSPRRSIAYTLQSRCGPSPLVTHASMALWLRVMSSHCAQASSKNRKPEATLGDIRCDNNEYENSSLQLARRSRECTWPYAMHRGMLNGLSPSAAAPKSGAALPIGAWSH